MLLVQLLTIVCLTLLMRSLPPTRDFNAVQDATSGLLVPMADPDWTRTQNAKRAARQFYVFWICLWVVWIGLYSVFSLKAIKCASTPVSVPCRPSPTAGATSLAPLDYIEDMLNMLNAGAFFLCYFVMVFRTTGEKNEATGGKERSEDTFSVWKVVLAVVLVSGVLVAAEMISDSDHVHMYFQGLEGFLTGVTLALLAGRLESPLIGSPGRISRHAVAAGLYTYALLQVAYIVLVRALSNLLAKADLTPVGQDHLGVLQDKAELVILTLAFAGKILLYWYVTRTLFKGGGLYWYMFAYRKHQDDDGIFVGYQADLRTYKELKPPNISAVFVQDATAKKPRAPKPLRRVITIGRDRFLGELLKEHEVPSPTPKTGVSP